MRCVADSCKRAVWYGRCTARKSTSKEFAMANVALVLADDFEDSEFRIPYDRLVAAGHQVAILGKKKGELVKGKKGKESATIEAATRERRPSEFDALVIPGGYSPDQLRTDENVVIFVQEIARAGKPVAAVCHGPSLLIEASVVRGKKVTSWPSIRTDLENAGAHWLDLEVVQDGALITSRKPDDLEAFSSALLKALS
jgi:protease I